MGFRIIVAGLIASLATLLPTAASHAAGLNWEIEHFDVTIAVREDGALDVTESIVADFSRDAHHGIYRDIPYKYRRAGTDFRLRIDVNEISDGAGNPWWHRSSRSDGLLHLKIGDPDRTFGRTMRYVIRYTVRRALLRFETHDELYWNATGNDWAVPIEATSCTVVLPESVPLDTTRAASYAGAHASTAEGPEPEILEDQHALRFTLDRRLPVRAGLTVVVGWERGHVRTPTATTRTLWFLRDNAVVLTPLAALVLLLALWRTLGRDKGAERSIAVRYQPPRSLTPVEVGTIIDERVDPRDVTATIVGLAVRGYLRIEVRTDDPDEDPDPESIHFIRTDKSADDLKEFEWLALDRLFRGSDEVRLKDLRHSFYTTMNEIKDLVYKSLAREGYFDGHLGMRRGLWLTLGVIAAAATIAVGVALIKTGVFAPLSTIIAIVLTAPQFPLFAWFMPRKTARGRRALEEIKGLEEYILRAEKEDLEADAARARFEGLLPHAMALGIADELAERFSGIYDTAPAWYAAPPGHAISTIWLTHHLTRSNTAMTSALSSTPRSQGGWSSTGAGGGSSGFSGGGFSGGGFGGGGGGGW